MSFKKAIWLNMQLKRKLHVRSFKFCACGHLSPFSFEVEVHIQYANNMWVLDFGLFR